MPGGKISSFFKSKKTGSGEATTTEKKKTKAEIAKEEAGKKSKAVKDSLKSVIMSRAADPQTAQHDIATIFQKDPANTIRHMQSLRSLAGARLNDDITDVRQFVKDTAIKTLRENPALVKFIASNEAIVLACALLDSDVRDAIYDIIYPHVTSVRAMSNLISNRFGVSIVNTKKRWTLDALRAMYPNLSLLPRDHIQNIIFGTTGTHTLANSVIGSSGLSWQETNENTNVREKHVEVDYGISLSDKTDTRVHKLGRTKLINYTMYDKNDRMTKLNAFDTTLIHEIGHNVDEASSNPTRYSSLPGFRQLDGIDWKEYPLSDFDIMNMMLEIGAEYSNFYDPSLDQIQLDSMDTRSAATWALRKLVISGQGYGTDQIKQYVSLRLGRNAQKQTINKMVKAIEKSKIYSILKHGRANNNPFLKGAFGGGTRQFVQGYEGKAWFSYNTAALGDKISRYQMRDPSEDFAETYALYYTAPQKLSSHRRMWLRSVVLQNPASRIKFHAMTGCDPVTGEKGPLDLTQQQQ